MVDVKIAARAVIIDGGEILLVKHHGSDYYALPGGKRDDGESLQSALVRELEEEFGVAGAIVGDIICVNEFQYPGGSYSLELFFLIDNPTDFRKELNGTHTNDELAEIVWKTSLDESAFLPKQFIPICRRLLAGEAVNGEYLTEL